MGELVVEELVIGEIVMEETVVVGSDGRWSKPCQLLWRLRLSHLSKSCLLRANNLEDKIQCLSSASHNTHHIRQRKPRNGLQTLQYFFQHRPQTSQLMVLTNLIHPRTSTHFWKVLSWLMLSAKLQCSLTRSGYL